MPKTTTQITALSPTRWDIFCTVIDNYGDIGVSWRLANLLTHDHQQKVRLWVDNLTALQTLHPQTQPHSPYQILNNIEVCQWQKTPDTKTLARLKQVAEVTIEAFGCNLPDVYLEAMGKKQAASKDPTACLWINLEYLTAEPWATDIHGLSGLQLNGVKRTFFFPGFTSGTGGLMCEKDYTQRHQSFTNSPQQQKAFCQHWQIPFIHKDQPNHPNTKIISLFSYENKALTTLIQQLATAPHKTLAYLPTGKLLTQLNQTFSLNLQPGQQWQTQHLTIAIVPFLPQAEYDKLLWLCDLNFVRGEESFVRAQWAGKPLIWHIYPTEDNAHWDKLKAFLDIYPAPQALQQFTHHWNAQTLQTTDWQALISAQNVAQKNAQAWQSHLKQLGELTTNLIAFVKTHRKTP